MGEKDIYNMKKYLLQRIIGELVSIVSQLLLFEFINYIKKRFHERKNKKKKKHWLRSNMIIVEMCGGKAKGLANTGGAVSPSSSKKKPSSKLTVMDTNPRCYGEWLSLY